MGCIGGALGRVSDSVGVGGAMLRRVPVRLVVDTRGFVRPGKVAEILCAAPPSFWFNRLRITPNDAESFAVLGVWFDGQSIVHPKKTIERAERYYDLLLHDAKAGDCVESGVKVRIKNVSPYVARFRAKLVAREEP